MKHILLLLLSSFLLVIATATNIAAAFAQDSEGDENDDNNPSFSGQIANVFGADPIDTNNTTTGEENTTTGGPRTYQDFSRAEVIDNSGNVINPGGANNRNINLGDEESMTRPTNIEDMIIPQTVERQDYADMKILLQAAGFAVSDMQYVKEFNTGISTIIVRGIEGVPTQPNMMDVESIGAAYGYALASQPVYIGNAWQVEFRSVTNN